MASLNFRWCNYSADCLALGTFQEQDFLKKIHDNDDDDDDDDFGY